MSVGGRLFLYYGKGIRTMTTFYEDAYNSGLEEYSCLSKFVGVPIKEVDLNDFEKAVMEIEDEYVRNKLVGGVYTEQVILPKISEYQAFGGKAEVIYKAPTEDEESYIAEMVKNHYVLLDDNGGDYDQLCLVSPAMYVWLLKSSLEESYKQILIKDGLLTDEQLEVLAFAELMSGMTWMYGEPTSIEFRAG